MVKYIKNLVDIYYKGDFMFEAIVLGTLGIAALASVFLSDEPQKIVKKNITIPKDDSFINEFLEYIKNNFDKKIENLEWITVEEVVKTTIKYEPFFKQLILKKNLSESEKRFKQVYEKYFTENGNSLNNEQQVFNINKRYIEHELEKNKELFDNIDGKSLDLQQRTAAIIDDNKLVVAGAGSGKTLTIAGTVKYLIDSKKINPEDILLMTFTKKAANEMKERIVNKLNINVDVYTFHALGNKIIHDVEGIKQSVLEDNFNKKLFSFLKEYTDLVLEIIEYNNTYKKKNIEGDIVYNHSIHENIKYREVLQLIALNKGNKQINLTEEQLKIYKKISSIDNYYKNKIIKDIELITYSDKIEEQYTRKDLKTLRTFLKKAFCQDIINKATNESMLLDQKSYEYILLMEKIDNNKKELKSINQEVLKSYEEVLIANYLLRNNIKYEYEHPYQKDTATDQYRQYRPDFYLPEYNIYIEHFGINRDGKTPQYTPEEEKIYLKAIQWKRKLHKINNTKLIESYSYEFSEGNFPKNLHDRLVEQGVIFTPIPKEKLERFANFIENEFNNEKSRYKDFMSFIQLFKNNNFSYDYLDQILSTIKNTDISYHYSLYIKNKELIFIEIVKKLYKVYEEFLKEQKSIDFSDMISKAINDIDKYNKKYKYIIIDEYQDTSKVRCNLITKLKEKNDNCKVMAVGDDWQSIYRFAGNDLGLFINFSDYLGYGLKVYIEKTYRNSQELVEIASKFITQNPNQLQKKLFSNKKLNDNPIKAIEYLEDKNSYIDYDENGELYSVDTNTNLNNYFDMILDDIKKNNPKAKTVMILGRYRTDAKILYKELGFKKIKKNGKKEIKYKNYDFEFLSMTIHGSKGLEADEVIVIFNDFNGFPSEIKEDPIFRFVLSQQEDYPYAEERRVFYVATTRTRNHVYLIFNKQKPSKFILELQENKFIKILNKDTIKSSKEKQYEYSIENIDVLLKGKEKPKVININQSLGSNYSKDDNNLSDIISKAKNNATSFEEFKNIMMKNGYSVKWKLDNKHVTFINIKNNHKRRLNTLIKNNFLSEEFTKENMEKYFDSIK